MQTSPLFNQQVAANIRYEIVPASTHKALKAAPVFNLVAAVPAKLIIHRPWFALDRNTEIEKHIQTLISPEKAVATLSELEGADLATLLAGEKHEIDPQELAEILKNAASGTIHLKFAEGMPHAEVAQVINEAIPFKKLSTVLERMSRALTHDGRGGLLQVDVSYTAGIDFTNARPL